MTFAAEWPTTTELSRTSVDTTDDLAPDESEWAAAAVEERSAATDADFSLTALVRQWVNASEALERQDRPEGDDSPLRPKWTPPLEDLPAQAVPMVPMQKQTLSVLPVHLINSTTQVSATAKTPSAAPRPALPRRRRQIVPRPTRRLAVLIDAETTSAESADVLFDALTDQGTISVCRAYGDWTSPDARGWWSAPLRQHGIQPYHHFGEAHDQRALVALTIDAVDLARESAVDVVVIAGDLASLHPLIVRLNASGIQVIAVGTTPTPQDVRELCHEFVDLSGETDADQSGRHRA